MSEVIRLEQDNTIIRICDYEISFRKIGATQAERFCKECGRGFEPNTSGRRKIFCSAACRNRYGQRLWREKHRKG